MKIKLLFTALLLTTTHVFVAQEIKKETVEEKVFVVKDTIKSVGQSQINSVVPAVTAGANTEAQLAKQKADAKAKKVAEKVNKAEAKAKEEAEDRQKEIIKNQKKLEKQQDKIEKEQKEQAKKQEKIKDAEEDINNANDKVKEAQKDLLKDTEKYNKQLAKGKLSPVDIVKYEKEKSNQEKKIENLKSKVIKAEGKLRKLKQ